ncbi:MAG TPA: GNAT family N-acetyltransferase [Lachnoclostridium phytofermentans]|uniref:Aminoglycoside N(6')-acetyltransferase type 1 n=2 Tax=Lachnoclostridium TaxID=1506553 RepID=A0A3D2XB75_9FIRM|nr:GNAT family N-acetyltransferase [Lachnoclostridium phytofermentans]
MIKKATQEELHTLAQLAILLWPDHTLDELEDEFLEYIEKEDATFYIAYKDDISVGFAQCQLRYDYVEGTSSSPVGYLEGIFIKEEYRNQGYASRLLKECENWAKTLGCGEFASDCELSNQDSLVFHLTVGFEEANRIICFTKKL